METPIEEGVEVRVDHPLSPGVPHYILPQRVDDWNLFVHMLRRHYGTGSAFTITIPAHPIK